LPQNRDHLPGVHEFFSQDPNLCGRFDAEAHPLPLNFDDLHRDLAVDHDLLTIPSG
jgi:hypothetical protein